MALEIDEVKQVKVERVFIGAGCNRTINNVSWGACDLVSFGSQNAVAVFCPKTAKILTTLPGHKASVNCTHWLPSSKFAFKAKGLERHFLVSGDADGIMILWEYHLTGKKWRHVLELPHLHTKGVTCINGIMISHNEAVFASTSSDCTTNVWELVFPSNAEDDCRLSCLLSLSIGSKPMLTLSLSELPGSPGRLVLAFGGLDNKIFLYLGERTGKFVRVCELKGHNGWIQSLDFSLPIIGDGEVCVLLVSASQDKGIRIWKVASSPSSDERKDQEISLSSYMKGPIIAVGLYPYQVSMESLLIGHEDWVYSVAWQPPFSLHGNECYQPQSLLSASMDKTMMIWQPEKTTGIWMNVVTVGELGHCALGFYGGHWSSTGDSILAYGYGGSFHLWRNVGAVSEDWKPQKVPSGHFASVSDIAWARCGEYIMSVSYDQTTRIFAPWSNRSSSGHEETWHEIARPQVHGHDINCVTIIEGKGNHRYVSGAEEKVSRVFEAPLSFLKTLMHATSLESRSSIDVEGGVQILGANMSALGLSQKPIYSQDMQKSTNQNKNDGLDTFEIVPEAVPVEFMEPPIEEQLAWHTLWPESHKLYGHGNELYSLCCNHEGTLVASSCKAQSALVADIWLWQVGSWKSVGRLHSHSLTVTKMEFSYDDNFLLTVSRDRHISIFSIMDAGMEGISYELVTKQEAHKRIIWACSWNPFGHEFVTGSRDKTVKVWSLDNGSSVRPLMTLPPFKSSVTALSWLCLNQQSNHGFVAVGLESGLIELWSLSSRRSKDGEPLVPTAACLVRMDPFLCHVSPVHRLAWRKSESSEDCRSMQLASCGADHTVRVFDVTF